VHEVSSSSHTPLPQHTWVSSVNTPRVAHSFKHLAAAACPQDAAVLYSMGGYGCSIEMSTAASCSAVYCSSNILFWGRGSSAARTSSGRGHKAPAEGCCFEQRYAQRKSQEGAPRSCVHRFVAVCKFVAVYIRVWLYMWEGARGAATERMMGVCAPAAAHQCIVM
jgi:hypothetical protein